jgi:hypothetical protein
VLLFESAHQKVEWLKWYSNFLVSLTPWVQKSCRKKTACVGNPVMKAIFVRRCSRSWAWMILCWLCNGLRLQVQISALLLAFLVPPSCTLGRHRASLLTRFQHLDIGLAMRNTFFSYELLTLQFAVMIALNKLRQIV